MRLHRIPLLIALAAVVAATGACGASESTQSPATTQTPVLEAVSPDVIAYSYADEMPFVHTIRADGSGDQRLIDYVTAPAWSPDGTQIAAGDEGILLYEAPWKQGKQLGYGLCDEPAWSPDGSKIACFGPTADDGSISQTYDDLASLWLLDVRTAAEEHLLDIIGYWGEYPDAPSWSPDGKQLAVADDNVVRILDLDTRRVTTVGQGMSPDWSPNGDMIAYSTGNSIVLARPDGRDRRTVVTSEDTVDQPSWSPDSTRIVYAEFSGGDWPSLPGEPRGLRIVDASGGEVRVLTRDGFDPDWRPRIRQNETGADP